MIAITGTQHKSRWYDNDATVSLAVSVLRNSDIDKQILAAKKIIEIAKLSEIEVKDVAFYMRPFSRRWYDVDEELCLAMESFRAANPQIQKKIALQVINYLCELEN